MTLPTYFLSHGGGPWPWVTDWKRMFHRLEKSLQELPNQLAEKPKAVLMVSGHWQAAEFGVMSSAQPATVYDYQGMEFPAETYEIVYSAAGCPELAARTQQLIASAGMPAHLDNQVGFDHGSFVPMHVMWPDASVPTFQVSVKNGYDPQAHVQLGRALRPLRDEGVLIIGSGMSYHNLHLVGPQAEEPSVQFDDWLAIALDAAPHTRLQHLIHWEQAPCARTCHPQEDHFIPLHVALGAAEHEKATRIYHDTGLFGGISASSYRFG